MMIHRRFCSLLAVVSNLVIYAEAELGLTLIDSLTADHNLGVVIRLDKGKSGDSFKERMKNKFGDKYDMQVRGVMSTGSQELIALESPDTDVLQSVLEDIDVAAAEYISPYASKFEPGGAQPIWHLDRINQRDQSLDGNTDQHVTGKADGKGVDIYVVDSGVNVKHSSLWKAFNFYNVFTDEGAEDYYGHGTHVAALVGGTFGPATGSTIYSVKVLDKNGSGSTLTVLTGLNRILAKVTESKNLDNLSKNQVIVVMSLTGSPSPAVDAMIVQLYLANVLVVVAAGNQGANACAYTPARNPAAVTVGASNINDEYASYSNFGSCVDIIAPGTDITSASKDGVSVVYSGTSMAAPLVAGVAAMLWSQEKELSARQVRRNLLIGSTYINGYDYLLGSTALQGTPNRFLFGRLEVIDATFADFESGAVSFDDVAFAAGFDTAEPMYLWEVWAAERRKRYGSQSEQASTLPTFGSNLGTASGNLGTADKNTFTSFYLSDTGGLLSYAGIAAAEVEPNGNLNLNGVNDHLDLVGGSLSSIEITQFLYSIGYGEIQLTLYDQSNDDGGIFGKVMLQSDDDFEASRRRYRG
ncbi:hypothetical protein SARC_04350 [Sphaeroforma arctica JP610]|uniref:Peptidase S8/S53 domain-containing protein n=1 Tax=Sphaeroforma arctica JP610 TaxID=667725 RepID=A0A0L0G3D4_9EUKA|nr:hypothetical protein SARC_04350 [Sphaeroforma arctica JP610]KNC83384.1 hypothetical protein SARC_04350 [Sphaeroforma arctica JP610]|eukprot:XP_014157286.1 hypothetical protein SARC_04350 [Sphaeroforma arctica JP610]